MLLITAASTKVNGNTPIVAVSDMARECRSGMTEASTRVNGSTIEQMGPADSFTQMATSMSENGRTTRHRVKALILTLTEPSTKESGLKINNTVMERRLGLMVRSIQVTI